MPAPLNAATVERNRQALERFEASHGPIKQAMEDIHGNLAGMIHYLRSILGFRCASCGGYPTYGNIRHSGYVAETRCYTCQVIK